MAKLFLNFLLARISFKVRICGIFAMVLLTERSIYKISNLNCCKSMKNYCFIKKKGISLALGLLLLGGASIFAANQVNLSVGIFKPVPSIPGHGKSPILIPSVWQDGYELSFPSSHVEYTLNLLLDGGVAYSVIVAEDAVSVTLPSWLEGDYEIQLHTGGSYYFFGDITL